MFKNKNKILTFFLLIVGTSYSEDCFRTGECQDSFFFTGASKSDEYACLEFCKSENNCNWLTFNPTTSFCKLFGNCLVLDTQYCSNCLTAQADCIPDEPACWVGGNCVGIALHSKQTPSAEDCLQLCDSTFGCRWFTYFTSASECVLLKNCLTIDQSCGGCISGERRCIQDLFSSSTATTSLSSTTAETPKGMTKLLVAAGQSRDFNTLTSVEIVNLDGSNPNLICENLPDLQNALRGKVGQLYAKTSPIICGGYVTNECQSFFNGNWTYFPSLCEFRTYSAAVAFSNPSREEDDIILVSGGIGYGGVLSSVESFDGQFWNQTMFASLPKPFYAHCMVKINNSMLLLIGGAVEDTTAAASTYTYFFDVLNNQWISGPQLNTERCFHSCGVMHWNNPDTGTSEEVVVVAGGKDSPGYMLSSVELLFLKEYETSKQGWTLGPALPTRIERGLMTEFQDGVILVGGYSQYDGRHLYQLSTPNGPWTEMKQTLKEGRYEAVSFLIPDEIANCH